MRDIKFRNWDKEKKKMEYRDFEDIMNYGWVQKAYFDDFVFMQYTGLKDKNGKEIYEGDIIRAYTFISEEDSKLNEYTIHQIKYMVDSDYPAFDLDPFIDCESNGLSYMAVDIDSCGVEVIGNIYENPKLLEQAK